MKVNRRLFLAAAMIAGLGVGQASAAGDKLIAGIVFQQDQFFRALQIGMQDAAGKAGYKLLEANSESKPDKEASLINTYISRGVDAIIISPISEAASAQALQRAKDAGIKVITYNSNVKGDIATSFLNSSQTQIGETTGEAAATFIKEKLGGKAKIGVLQFKSLLPEQSGQRVNGFLSKAKIDGVEIVADQDAWLAEKAVAVASDIITANPDINILFAANEGGTVGAVQAVRNAGKQGKIFVFGTDGSEQIANFLLSDDDVLQAVTAQKPFQMGVDAVNTAVAAIEGKPVEKTVIVPVQGLSRTDPAEVKAFKESLKQFK